MACLHIAFRARKVIGTLDVPLIVKVTVGHPWNHFSRAISSSTTIKQQYKA